MYVCMHVRTYVRMYVCMYVCLYVSMYDVCMGLCNGNDIAKYVYTNMQFELLLGYLLTNTSLRFMLQ